MKANKHDLCKYSHQELWIINSEIKFSIGIDIICSQVIAQLKFVEVEWGRKNFILWIF